MGGDSRGYGEGGGAHDLGGARVVAVLEEVAVEEVGVARAEEGLDARGAHAEQQVEVAVRQQPGEHRVARRRVPARHALPSRPSHSAYRAHHAPHQGLAVLHVPREVGRQRGAHQHQLQRLHDLREDEALRGLQRRRGSRGDPGRASRGGSGNRGNRGNRGTRGCSRTSRTSRPSRTSRSSTSSTSSISSISSTSDSPLSSSTASRNSASHSPIGKVGLKTEPAGAAHLAERGGGTQGELGELDEARLGGELVEDGLHVVADLVGVEVLEGPRERVQRGLPVSAARGPHVQLVRVDVHGVLEHAREQDEALVEELLAEREVPAAERREAVADVVEHRYGEAPRRAYAAGCGGRRAAPR